MRAIPETALQGLLMHYWYPPPQKLANVPSENFRWSRELDLKLARLSLGGKDKLGFAWNWSACRRAE